MTYKQLTFIPISEETSSILIALLSENGFEGFEEGPDSLKAFIPADAFNETEIDAIAGSLNLEYTVDDIAETNWNARWESGFEPVVIDDFLAIRAHFHEAVPAVKYDIIITPKMSFGTGHHATTYLIAKSMEHLDFNGKTVFDFGTGTGILAILAEKMGAGEILAIDYDKWSIENSRENLERNHCTHTTLKLAGSATDAGRFDIILANINRQVILDNIAALKENLIPGGILLLSGLLEDDETIVHEKAGSYGLILREKNLRQGWISLKYSH